MKPTDDPKTIRKQPITHTKVHVVYLVPLVGMLPQFLWKQMNWNNPRTLVNDYVNAISAASKGAVSYHVVSERTVPKPFRLQDGYEYRPEELLSVIERKKDAHTPSFVDYKAILNDQILLDVQHNKIDEVWIMGYPFAGLWESAMGGPDAYNINGGPIQGTESTGRRFVIMGFNYERGVGEMLESFGHRVERTLSRAFGADQYLNWFYDRANYGIVPKPAVTLWEQFLCDKGTVHREAGAPATNPDHSAADYFWHHGIEEHHRRWLADLLPDWWKRVVNVNGYR